MIIEIRAKNCFVFEDDIVFSMKADMRNKKFGSNVHKRKQLQYTQDSWSIWSE